MWGAEHRALTIGIVSLVTLFAFEGIATTTAMPAVAKDLDALGGYTWAFSAYVAASLIAMVGGGLWADASGPRDPLVASVVTFAAGATVAGLAPGLPLLVAGRALEGRGGGALIVGLYVLIARAYSVQQRPRVFSVVSAAWVIPSLVGPLLAGWLTDNVSWRAVFLLVPVFVIPPAILLFPRIRGLHEGVPHASTRTRLIAGLAATFGLFAVQDGVLRLSVAGGVEFLIGVVVLLVSLRYLLPHGALVLRRGLPTTVMMRGFLSGAFFAAEVFLPLALVQIRDLSITQAGLVLAASATMWSIGSFLQARIPGDRDRGATVRAGALLIAASVLTLPLCLLPAVPPWIAAFSWAVGSLGMGLAMPSIAVQVMRLSPESDQGINSAAIQIIDSVTVVLAVSILGLGHAQAVAAGGATAATYTVLWLGAGALALVGAAVAGRMRPLSIDIAG
ncbi:MAG: MFS transporter [Actinomycetes bacterium]